MKSTLPAPWLGCSLVCALVAYGTACGDGDAELPCVAVTTACQPIVNPPTFDAIYQNIFQSSCTQSNAQCHNAAVSAGLDMRSADVAFQGLSTRIDPKNLGCSLLIRRLEATSPSVRMPPGPKPLSEAQRCAIRQWIENGGER